jgi:hypothetical protein
MSSGEIVISGGNNTKNMAQKNRKTAKKTSSTPKIAGKVPTKTQHYADMKRLNSLYKSHDAAMRKRDMAFRKRQEELNKVNTKECTFQPHINRHRRPRKSEASLHTETILHQWSSITEEEVKLLEEFENNKSMVPLNVGSGDVVKIIQKRVGKSKYWCHVVFRDIEGLIPMRCLSQYSGFDRLYKKGLQVRKEKDVKHRKRMEKPKDIKECTFQPDLITRKNANGRYWLSKVGASSSPPQKVLASGLLVHNKIKSPNLNRLPLAKSSSIQNRKPNPPLPYEDSHNTEFRRNKRNNNSNNVRRKRMLQIKKKGNSYLNRKLSPTSKFKYGIDRSIELPYWDERAMALENTNDNAQIFSTAIEKIFTKTRTNTFDQDPVEKDYLGQVQTVDELKRIELLNGLEAELLRTEFVAATEQITDELKSLRFQLSQQHEALLSKTPAAIQQNLEDNPHLVRAARTNLKFLKSKKSPNVSPLRNSPTKNVHVSPSLNKKIQSSPNKTNKNSSVIQYSVDHGSPIYVNNKHKSSGNNTNGTNHDSTSPFSAGKRHHQKVQKYRRDVLKSLNKRIGGFG